MIEGYLVGAGWNYQRWSKSPAIPFPTVTPASRVACRWRGMALRNGKDSIPSG